MISLSYVAIQYAFLYLWVARNPWVDTDDCIIIWPGLGKPSLCVQELKSILLININCSYNHALSIHCDRTVIDGQVCFYRWLFSWSFQAIQGQWHCLGGSNKVACVCNCSQTSITCYQMTVPPCSVVRRPCGHFFSAKLVPVCLKPWVYPPLSPPPHPSFCMWHL